MGNIVPGTCLRPVGKGEVFAEIFPTSKQRSTSHTAHPVYKLQREHSGANTCVGAFAPPLSSLFLAAQATAVASYEYSSQDTLGGRRDP